jgi:Tol biopolymer transport system component
VVVTASDAMQYSFEGGSLVEQAAQPSVFTGAVVDALSTGDADEDGDGWVDVHELFRYVEDSMQRRTTDQTPLFWVYGAHGDICIARSRVRRVVPTPLEPELTELLASSVPAARLGVVETLRKRLTAEDLGRAYGAWQELERRSRRDDSIEVRAAAIAAIGDAELRVSPRSVDLGAEPVATLHLRGPAFARVVTVTADQPWVDIECEGAEVRVSVKEGRTAEVPATLTLTGPTGTTAIAVAPPSNLAGQPAGPPDTGDQETGDQEAGDQEAGDQEAGDQEAGDQEAGDQDTGKQDTVDGPEDSADNPPTVVLPVPPPPPRPWWKVAAAAATAVVVVIGVVAWRSRGDTEGGTPPQGAPVPDDALVWVRQVNGEDRIEVGVFGQSPTLLPLTGLWPTLTRDRRTLLYLDGPRDAQKVWVAGAGGEQPQVLIDDPGCPDAGRPSVNPDGTEIAVICSDGQDKTPGIRIYDVDGRLDRTLDTEESGELATPTWTADGSFIVYSRSDGDGGNLYGIPADGGVSQQLTFDDADDVLPAVSPDKSSIVFVRNESSSGTETLYLLEVDFDGERYHVTDPVPMKASEGASRIGSPTLSPDGQSVAFVKDDVVLVAPLDAEAPGIPQEGLEAGVRHLAWARR